MTLLGTQSAKRYLGSRKIAWREAPRRARCSNPAGRRGEPRMRRGASVPRSRGRCRRRLSPGGCFRLCRRGKLRPAFRSPVSLARPVRPEQPSGPPLFQSSLNVQRDGGHHYLLAPRFVPQLGRCSKGPRLQLGNQRRRRLFTLAAVVRTVPNKYAAGLQIHWPGGDGFGLVQPREGLAKSRIPIGMRKPREGS